MANIPVLALVAFLILALTLFLSGEQVIEIYSDELIIKGSFDKNIIIKKDQLYQVEFIRNDPDEGYEIFFDMECSPKSVGLPMHFYHQTSQEELLELMKELRKAGYPIKADERLNLEIRI